MSDSPEKKHSLFASHGRDFRTNRYIYPVISRRAHGVSVGVNISPDKACNFSCVYCQVDRSSPSEACPIDLARLREELEEVVELVVSERLFEGPRFKETPTNLRRLNDIAFSGDGEPTLCRQFDEVVKVCAEVRRQHSLDDVKLVLITNATLLHLPHVQRALEIMDTANGEIWGKLDAGTEAYYARVARSRVALPQVIDNLTAVARRRPIIIQSLFMRLSDEPPSEEEQLAYCQRLREIVDAGGQIKLVQIHTVVRMPAEDFVSRLSYDEVDALGELVRRQTGLPVATFYG